MVMIQAEQFLKDIVWKDKQFKLIDVRSEREFHHGAFPASVNFPILTDRERKEIGITYKQLGQQAAIERGQEIVAPFKAARVDSWNRELAQVEKNLGFVTCWRGGLRSSIAFDWIRASGREVKRIQGGYKALRLQLLKNIREFSERDSDLMVVSGQTGAGKTKLLQQLASEFPKECLDLEALACHRGSSFGAHPDRPQPSQQNFENNLSLKLHPDIKLFVVEHEGTLIGRVKVPDLFYRKLVQSPIVFLESSMEERIRHTFQEYVANPVAHFGAQAAHQQLLLNLKRIQRKLGGARFNQIAQSLGQAFQGPGETCDLLKHSEWIQELLTQYYDPMYQHFLNKAEEQAPIIFKGAYKDCYGLLRDRLNRLRS